MSIQLLDHGPEHPLQLSEVILRLPDRKVDDLVTTSIEGERQVGFSDFEYLDYTRLKSPKPKIQIVKHFYPGSPIVYFGDPTEQGDHLRYYMHWAEGYQFQDVTHVGLRRDGAPPWEGDLVTNLPIRHARAQTVYDEDGFPVTEVFEVKLSLDSG
ncbi:MAG: hypothetical protein IPN34_13190 [Planctomycetes bacterium]|nr:hypothetical protein [Planctomycetota bacterium]